MMILGRIPGGRKMLTFKSLQKYFSYNVKSALVGGKQRQKSLEFQSSHLDKKGCTGACHSKWNKSEREAPVQYINSYVWKLERRWWQLYMQDSKRDTDGKSRLLDSVGEGEGGMICKNNIETCILPYVK